MQRSVSHLQTDGAELVKCTRVADRAFPEVKVTRRQPGDFSRSAFHVTEFGLWSRICYTGSRRNDYANRTTTK